jgi:hypothetical protein
MNKYLWRAPLLMCALLALLAALWAGLLRLGWAWTPLNPMLPMRHGPLMVSAFFGTLIGLERAVALGKPWTYLSPLLSGLGGVLLLLDVQQTLGAIFLVSGSLGLVLIFVSIVRRYFALYTVIMALGSLCWLVGSLVWLGGKPVYTVVFWWIGFLVLTITGERLELSRVARITPSRQAVFLAACVLFLGGIVFTGFNFGSGARLAGLGMVGLAGWLIVFDIARRNIQKTGLTRFIAICLFTGYIWLGTGGLLALIYGGVSAGLVYDAMLHAIFLGFVFGMVFGHAPIILPGVLNIPLMYHWRLYIPLALLNASLMLRLVGDLGVILWARQWGGLLNAVAILLYLGMMVHSIARTRHPVRASSVS